MDSRPFSSFNLNLLRALRALLETRSVTRAGERIGLSQPAMSTALANLRSVFDDALLVPAGRSMELTPRAQTLAGRVDEICRLIEALGQTDEICPDKISRNFVIASVDYSALIIAPKLLRELTEIAPRASIQFIDVTSNKDMLLPHRGIDFFIVPRYALMSTPYRELASAKLFDDAFVFAMSPEHPLAKSRSTDPAAWANARYAVYRLGLESISQEIEALIPGEVAFRAQQFSVLPLMAPSGCIALVPRRVAQEMSSHLDLAIRELLPPHPGFEMMLAWDKLHDLESDEIRFARILSLRGNWHIRLGRSIRAMSRCVATLLHGSARRLFA